MLNRIVWQVLTRLISPRLSRAALIWQVLALDLADLAQGFSDGSFSVLGHSREELRLGTDGVMPRHEKVRARPQMVRSSLPT